MGFFIVVTTTTDDTAKFLAYQSIIGRKVLRYFKSKYFFEERGEGFQVYTTDDFRVYILEWPHLVHDNGFFTSSYCPSESTLASYGIEMKGAVNVEEEYIEATQRLVPLYTHYMQILGNEYINSTTQMESVNYKYCVAMFTYYYYVKTQVPKIATSHKATIFANLTACASIGYVLKEVQNYVRKYSQIDADNMVDTKCGNPDYMTLESIMMSYEDTDAIFNQFKGIFLAQLVVDNTRNGAPLDLPARIVSHALSHMYITAKVNNVWTYMKYDGTWTKSQTGVSLNDTIAGTQFLLNTYINKYVLHVIGATDAYASGLSKLKSKVTQSALLDNVRIRLQGDTYTENSKAYVKTLRFEKSIYDLTTGKLRNSYPHDVQSVSTRYEFYHTEDPVIEAELDDIMSSYFLDAEILDYIYQIFGRALAGNISDKSIWVFLGESNVGKSKFMELVRMAFGGYADVLSGDYLNVRTKGNGATTGINKVIGKLLGIIQEPRRGGIDVEAVKEITGDSHLSVRQLYHESETVHNTIRYVVCANNLSINSFDGALWNRVRIVKFVTKFVSESTYNEMVKVEGSEPCRIIDPDIDAKFARVAPALMKRFINAYHRTEHVAMHHPQAVIDATHAFRLEADITAKFFNSSYSKCEDDGRDISFDEVYTMYKIWHTSKHGDHKNYLEQSRLMEAARSNGYIVANNKLIGVVSMMNADDSRLITYPYSTGTVVLPGHRHVEYNSME